MVSRLWGSSRTGLRGCFPTGAGGTLPSCSVAPAISPAGPVASGTQLTMSQGTWANASTFSYSWSEDGVPVGVNANTYTSSKPGAVITGSVTANGTRTAAASNSVSVQGQLVDLAFTANSVVENSAVNTVIGTVLNKTASSVLGFTDDAGGRVKWSGNNLVVGGLIDFDTLGSSFTFIPNETLAGMSNSPHDTLGLSISVINQNDTNPNAFSLGSVIDVALSSVNIASMTVAGLGQFDSVTATVSGDASRLMRLTRNNVVGQWVAGPITNIVNGDQIEVQLTASSVNSTASSVTLAVGTTSSTFTVTTQAAFQVPPDATLTLLSAPGASLVMAYKDPNHGQGQIMQWEFTNTQSPTFNADGSFATTITQSGIDFVDGESYANLQETMGYSVPFGDFSVHVRPMIDDDAGSVTVVDPRSGVSSTYTAGNWTNVISGNIQISVAVLATTPNNKSGYLQLSNGNLSWKHTANVGAECYVRATNPALGDKFDFAIQVDNFYSTGNGTRVGFAMSDLAMDLDSPGYFTSNWPGYTSSTNNGFNVELASGSSTGTLYINGGISNFNLGAACAIGDQLVCQVDKSNIISPVIKFWFVDVSAGTTTLVKTITMTSKIPATNAWYFMALAERGQTNSPYDAGTWFPDASSIRAHDAGFTIYG